MPRGGVFQVAAVTFALAVLGRDISAAIDDRLRLPGPPGIPGGRLVSAQRTEPKTLNWLVASDAGSRAVAERLFDGVYILPRHRLEAAWSAGKLGEAWTLNTPPAEIAGLGPFRLKSYAAGQQITLERNPYYWQSDSAGNQLPYLNLVT